ncbi:MAG: PKD domain-containing protein [Armatimonadota bacterium]
MKRIIWVVPIVLVLIAALYSGAAAAEREFVIYSGELDKADAGPWGNGSAENTDEQQYLERETLQVETNGFHEGGRLDLKSPEALKDFLQEPEKGFLVLVVKTHQEERREERRGRGDRRPGDFPPEDMFPEDMPPDMFPEEMPPGEWREGGRRGGPGPGGRGDRPGPMPPEEMPPEMMDPGMMEPGMDPGMDPGMMEPGMMPEDMMPGEGGPGRQPEAPPPMITKLRALLVTDEGQLDSGDVDILHAQDALENWYTMVIPLADFEGSVENPDAKLERIALFGDVKEKFWVGTVKLVAEDEPLVADAGEPRRVKVNEPVTFEAKAQPGNGNARYAWDFDSWDGLDEDAIGREATWPFLEPGFYEVTLTVSDRSGRHVTRVDTVDVLVEE